MSKRADIAAAQLPENIYRDHPVGWWTCEQSGDPECFAEGKEYACIQAESSNLPTGDVAAPEDRTFTILPSVDCGYTPAWDFKRKHFKSLPGDVLKFRYSRPLADDEHLAILTAARPDLLGIDEPSLTSGIWKKMRPRTLPGRITIGLFAGLAAAGLVDMLLR